MAATTRSRSTKRPIRSAPRRLRVRHHDAALRLLVDDDAERSYDYDMASRERTLRKRQEIPPATIPRTMSPAALYARGADGAEVPVSLLIAKTWRSTARAPLLLYGYGAYGIAMPASFSANRLSLVDRGFIYAIAHIRGGADKGWGWYLAGKREQQDQHVRRFRRRRPRT